eukprot:TRINITY_DN62158_c0_g1_i1.p1 TRINITY_DN62158_c0_g1~~TRINITY_DN62158_c0_g1_i1.p1  ORF type:complete len:564 (+),score=127.46 TRINITY_DN62158_c0_g1_i1:116-1693(+)
MVVGHDLGPNSLAISRGRVGENREPVAIPTSQIVVPSAGKGPTQSQFRNEAAGKFSTVFAGPCVDGSAASPSALRPSSPSQQKGVSTADAVSSRHDALFEYSQVLSQRVTSLEAELAKVVDQRDALRAESEAMGEHVFGLQQENGMLHDMGWTSFMEKSDLAKIANGSNCEVAHLQDTKKRQDERIKSLISENGRILADAEKSHGEVSQARHTIRALEATLKTVQANLAQRINREGMLAERVAATERQVNDLVAEKNQLDEVVCKQHVEIGTLKQVHKDLHAEKARNLTLTQKLEAASSEITNARKERLLLDHMVSNLHVEAAGMKTERDSALSEVPNLQMSLRLQTTSIGELETKVAQLNGQLQDAQRQNIALDRELKISRHVLEQNQKEKQRHEQALEASLADNARLHHFLEEMRVNKYRTDEMLTTTVSEKSLAHSQFEQLRIDKEQLHLHVQQLVSENVSLKSRLLGSETVAQGYQDEAAAMQQRLHILRSEKDEFEERLNHPSQQQQSRQHLIVASQGAL